MSDTSSDTPPSSSPRYRVPVPVQRFDTPSGYRIYRIACEVMPHYHGFSHLVLGEGVPATLIDTGSGSDISCRDLEKGLQLVATEFGERWNVADDLRRIWLTHTHHDHIGMAAELAERSGAELGVHRYDARLMVAWDENALLIRRATMTILAEAGVEPPRRMELCDAYAMRPRLVRSAAHVDRIFGTDTPNNVEREGPFTIHHVPGHSPGHVLFEIDGFLIGGDHLLSRTVSQLWPQRMTPFTGFGHMLDSLHQLERLAATGVVHTLLAGHEDVISDIPARTREVLNIHRRRNERVLELVAGSDHPVTASEVSDRMYTHRSGFFGFLVIADVVARFEHLLLCGEVNVANADEIARDVAIPRFTPTRFIPVLRHSGYE